MGVVLKRRMRAWVVVLCLSQIACATTVSRAPGEVALAAGGARNACESESWLVLANTRYQEPSGERALVRKEDGIGVYRVGATHPENVFGIEEQLSPALLQSHHEGVRAHDRDRLIAIGLGAGAAIALAAGTLLVVNSFETKTTVNPDGTRDEEQEVVGGRLAAGGLVLAAGFGIGIGGIAVAPSASDRARADAHRYVFRQPEDDLSELSTLVNRANTETRARCERQPLPQ